MTIVCLNRQPESHPRNKRLQTIHMNWNKTKITLSKYQEEKTDLTRILTKELFHYSSYARALSTQEFDCLGWRLASVLQLCSLESELYRKSCMKKCSDRQGPVPLSRSGTLSSSPWLCSCCRGHAWLRTSLIWTGPQPTALTSSLDLRHALSLWILLMIWTLGWPWLLSWDPPCLSCSATVGLCPQCGHEAPALPPSPWLLSPGSSSFTE